jgi:hypothetical protein
VQGIVTTLDPSLAITVDSETDRLSIAVAFCDLQTTTASTATPKLPVSVCPPVVASRVTTPDNSHLPFGRVKAAIGWRRAVDATAVLLIAGDITEPIEPVTYPSGNINAELTEDE